MQQYVQHPVKALGSGRYTVSGPSQSVSVLTFPAPSHLQWQAVRQPLYRRRLLFGQSKSVFCMTQSRLWFLLTTLHLILLHLILLHLIRV